MRTVIIKRAALIAVAFIEVMISGIFIIPPLFSTNAIPAWLILILATGVVLLSFLVVYYLLIIVWDHVNKE